MKEENEELNSNGGNSVFRKEFKKTMFCFFLPKDSKQEVKVGGVPKEV
jgi:hypothetical protein